MIKAAIASTLLTFASLSNAADHTTWKTYGGTPDQMHFSRLKQINTTNVAKLKVAWTYDTHESGDVQAQPVIVDGVMYAYTPTHRTIALNAATGELLWSFDAHVESSGPNRGVMYWSDRHDKRVFAAVGDFVYALEARTGKPIASFGEAGRIDLRRDLGRDPQKQSVRLTTPGVVYRDLMIVGGRVSETLPASPGFVRGYDVRTGKVRWTFHTIPQPAEAGYETWPKDAWTYIGGANSWSGMTLDEKRGVIYVPTGSAAADFYGGNRLGANLFANCLIAIKAQTGERLWHFQFVRHDILDRDLPSPPALVTVKHEGQLIDALAQPTKQGFVFLLDRDTGAVLNELEYVPVPKSDVPGEVPWDSQPLPKSPAPYARQTINADSLTNRTPEAAAWAKAEFAKMRSEGPFTPLTVGQDTVIFPGLDGGAEWGGPAYDPDTGLLYINANEMAWLGALTPNDIGHSGRSLYLQNCAACHGDDLQGSPPIIPRLSDVSQRRSRESIAAVVESGGGRMPGFKALDPEVRDAIIDYVTTGRDTETQDATIQPGYLRYRFTGYRRWVDPEGYPAVGPPWGTLNAIDLNTGKYAWRIPFGEFPELAAKGMKQTGSENYGGSIVTAGGLLFIGATNHDKKFHAFDKRTGELLWETTLPFSGNASPATYEIKGRQYVAILANGGKSRNEHGGVYVAFALPTE
jgi:quinoprotein glucose dehydrogenase